MHIDLPTDQQTLVENLVASGRFPSVQDAISEAINMLAAQEALRKEIQVGVDEADLGVLLELDTVFTQLKSFAATAPEIHGRPTAPIDYRTRGHNSVTVALVPSICYKRLVVFSVNTENTTGWAIRDFITNQMLEDEHSGRTRTSIETEVAENYSEYPPFYNVTAPDHAERWELYLILRTIAHHRRHHAACDMTAPDAAQGGDDWIQIAPEPPWAPLVL
ncbi:MAG: hypothetical protein HQ581_21070 [Planctomycetes bacterium]|nr:hypothetical protein [Planctomycetota bacterium]